MIRHNRLALLLSIVPLTISGCGGGSRNDWDLSSYGEAQPAKTQSERAYLVTQINHLEFGDSLDHVLDSRLGKPTRRFMTQPKAGGPSAPISENIEYSFSPYVPMNSNVNDQEVTLVFDQSHKLIDIGSTVPAVSSRRAQ